MSMAGKDRAQVGGTGGAHGTAWPWNSELKSRQKLTHLFQVALLFPRLKEVLCTADSNRVDINLVPDRIQLGAL